MIVDGVVNEITRGGIAGEKVFTFAFNKKMYDLMSTNLYSDRIGSTVREVCSNAWDAHVMANKSDVPFRITLPTELEPHFIVEDFGTGMPDDRAQELYSTMGLSTKEESNDVIGAFGLGSKVPFTVTDSFTVENTYNGITYFYLCFKNEAGFPSILKTGESPATKENGVKVVIPVSGSQYSNFCDALNRQLILMEPKPILTNGKEFEFSTPKILLENDYGFIIDNPSDFGLYNGSVYGKMGIVLYPIDTNQALNDNGYAYSTLFHKKFNNGTLVLKFNIGDLDPLPSREGLTYEQGGKTIEKIKEVYKKFDSEFRLQLLEKLKEHTLPYEAWKESEHIKNSLGVDLKVSTPGDILINGYSIKSPYPYTFESIEVETNVPELKSESGDILREATTVVESKPKYIYDTFKSTWRGTEKGKNLSITSISYSLIENILEGSISIVLMDEEEPKREASRKKHHFEEIKGATSYSHRSTVMFLSNSPYSNGDKFDFSEFKQAFDNIHPGLSNKFVNFSSIQVPIRKREKREVDDSFFKGVKIINDHCVSYEPLEKDAELDSENMFYILTYRGNLSDYSFSYHELSIFCQRCNLKVILVSTSAKKQIKYLEDNGICEFKEFVNDRLSGYKYSDEFKNYCALRTIYTQFVVSENGKDRTIRERLNLDVGPVARNYYRYLRDAKRAFDETEIDNLTTEENIALTAKTYPTIGREFSSEAECMKEIDVDMSQEFIVAKREFQKMYPRYADLLARITYGYYGFEELREYMLEVDELNYLRKVVENLREKEGINVVEEPVVLIETEEEETV